MIFTSFCGCTRIFTSRYFGRGSCKLTLPLKKRRRKKTGKKKKLMEGTFIHSSLTSLNTTGGIPVRPTTSSGSSSISLSFMTVWFARRYLAQARVVCIFAVSESTVTHHAMNVRMQRGQTSICGNNRDNVDMHLSLKRREMERYAKKCSLPNYVCD